MRGFDVLDPNLHLFENRFLEASAGTGKTFAIENLVIRLLDEGITLDEILVVTFTRAATVELKERIRSHLNPEQLIQFDEAKIWTIHSFCFHCLQEQALQTGFALDQFEESSQSALLKQIIKDALRTSTILTPKQLEKVLNERLIDRLVSLVSQRLPIEQPDWIFPKFDVDPETLLEDLIVLAPGYGKLCDRKKQVKPEVVEGLKLFTSWLAGDPVDPVDFPILKYVEANKLKRTLSPTLNHPGIVERMQEELIPKLASFSDSETILAVLAEEARVHLERVVKEEDLVFFEDLLRMMAEQVADPIFAQTVRRQYKAVLIDEFQDTDPLQWKIFSTLFLNEGFEGPVYLVGDPKQSIYRFRSADLYTYMEAKKAMGRDAYASLQTNYRSTPTLVEELNAFFAHDFITLPKTGEIIACSPVEAASGLPPIDDGKGSLHYLMAESEEALFSTIVHEISRLNIPLRECAVLVNDRHQAERFLKACSLPAVSKRSRSLLDSPAFETLIELIRAAQNPRDKSALARVLGGPFFAYPIDALPEEYERFYSYHHLLETEGLLSLFNHVVEESKLSDPKLYQDLLQLVEMGVHVKEDLLSFYNGLMQLDSDAEQLRAWATVEEDAIQVMTIHVSKGLEFSVVFPIGIAAPYVRRKGLKRFENRLVFSDPLSESEERAEKMRQLYVACTRAKQRLYVPVLENDSPITTFLENSAYTAKSSEACEIYPRPIYARKKTVSQAPVVLNKSYPACAMHSYTSLVTYEPREKHTLAEGIMPPGPQTGILIHKLFEDFDFENPETLHPFVLKALRGTFLEAWSEEAVSMMEWALNHPLPGPDGPFSLLDVNPKKIIKEMEFLYPSDEPPGFLKGFIDLFFEYEGGYYLIDWKTNIIDTTIEECVQEHHYDVQAEIYQNAVERYLSLFHDKPPFKGILYLFLRPKDLFFFIKN